MLKSAAVRILLFAAVVAFFMSACGAGAEAFSPTAAAAATQDDLKGRVTAEDRIGWGTGEWTRILRIEFPNGDTCYLAKPASKNEANGISCFPRGGDE